MMFVQKLFRYNILFAAIYYLLNKICMASVENI